MGQTVKLIRLIERLADLNDEDTIYACEPWTEESDAMVALEDPDRKPFGIPLEAAEAGMTYFLEVFIAREVVEGWLNNLDEKPGDWAPRRKVDIVIPRKEKPLATTFDRESQEVSGSALARFLGLGVDDVFPITVDVRRYVRGDPAALIAIVLKEPQERLTREELIAMAVRHGS